MSAHLKAILSKPVGYFNMDDPSPFQDYSGYNLAASATGAGTSLSLGNGFAHSTVVSNASQASLTSPIFKQGRESAAFTIEATVRIMETGTTAPVQILGNQNQMDGLVYDGTKIHFVTKYTSTGEARATYDLQVHHKVHLVGVHTRNKNMLYVNGELVATKEITFAQQGDTYASTSAQLYSGATTSNRKLAINGIGIYANALSPAAIRFNAAEIFNNSEVVYGTFGGERVSLYVTEADLFLTQEYFSVEDWRSGLIDNVSVESGSLTPVIVDNVSEAGTWTNAVLLQTPASTIYGVNVVWDGEGALVEASLDGTTWVTAQRGVNLSNVPPGTDPAGKSLFIRVSFPGGITADTSYLDNLTIHGFNTAGVLTTTRPVTLTNGYFMDDGDPSLLADDVGVRLNAGTLSIGPSPQGVAVKTVEVWVKQTTAISTSLTGATVYSNGGGQVALADGEWQLRTYTSAAGWTGNINITGSGQIGAVYLYPDQLTAAQVKSNYESFVGRTSKRANDTSVLGVAQDSPATQIYSHEWTISTTV